MQISNDLKEFLKDPELQELINDGKFDEIYNKLNSFKSEPKKLIGEFTSLLLQVNINPLNYMNEVPSNYLYANKEISTVIIPYRIKSIGSDAFKYCTALTKITIPNSVEFIGESAFSGSSITDITLPNKIKSIYFMTFSNCKSLTNIVIPNNVEAIGWGAFAFCNSLTNVTIPNSVHTIYDEAFCDCKSLINIIIPSSVKSIRKSAFDECDSLEAVYITDVAAWCGIRFDSRYSNPLTLAHNLYLNGKLITDLIIPDEITSVEDYAFCGCEHFKSITIGSGVENIGYEAFDDCGENAIQINYNGSISNFKKIKIKEYNNILRDNIIHCTNGNLKYNRFAQKWERV